MRNRENIHWLLYIFIEDDLLRAELYREAGDMERAIEVLNTLTPKDEFLQKVKNEILRRAKANNCRVFEISGLRD